MNTGAARRRYRTASEKQKTNLYLAGAPAVSDSMIHIYSRKAVDAEQRLDEFTFFQKLRAICNAEQQKRFDEIIQDALRRMAPPRRQGPRLRYETAGRRGTATARQLNQNISTLTEP